MALLDFERLRKRFESRERTRIITIVLYSKTSSGYKIHSSTEHSTDVLTARHANGSRGEKLFENDTLYVCIGSSEHPAKIRYNVRCALAGVFKALPNKSEIRFESSEYTEDAVYGLVIGGYRYDFLKSKKEEKVVFLNAPEQKRIIEVAHAQNFARFLGDTPANYMTPRLFVEYSKQFFGIETENVVSDDLAFEELKKDEIAEQGMHLMLSVSQGSREEPRLLKIRYQGRGPGNPDIALVGKGVTFDSGGISLKPSAGMASMKHDMMGAATLLAAMKLAALLNVRANLTAVFPLVENLPSSTATKPGDVFTSMSGKTVEVDNTDAEGRLILADAMTLAQKDLPRYLIDAATLTGAMVVSLGSVYCGYFCNDEEMAKAIEEAARKCDELVWRMPVSEFYGKSLKSHVADLVNVSGREGGSAKAAAFLAEFVNKGVKWAHFDIAGMMEKSFCSALYGDHATGRPLPAFLQIIEELIKN